MIGRYDAAINGTWLSEIGDSVVITDISEREAKTRISTAEKAIGNGLRFIRRQRESLSVSISFVIFEQDVERRKDILMRVQSWAAAVSGSVSRLEINDRRGQYLLVRYAELPAMASAMNYQDEMTVVFTAYELPYWMDQHPSKATITKDGSLFVPGIGETLVDAEITNTGSGTITSLTVACGETSLSFSGLSLGNGQTLSIAHDELGILSAKIGSTSVLANRTAESDDELVAVCGVYNPISVSGGTVSAVFKARGVYL